ncbi:MAG: flavin reductase family protein [Chloroflexi bacterium]|nr:flavin reductase family protein [Chloroflexota bacterium]
MEISPKDTPSNLFYKVIVGSVVPRPIAWVSTINETGQPNLAPFSFFNVVCPSPPTLLFCPGVRGTNAGIKDTYANVRASGEFVVNLVSEELAEAMNKTATELPPEVNEFEYAGLAQEASKLVGAPRVAESPVAFECKVTQIVDVGDGGRGSGWVVLGEVVHMRVKDDVLGENYRIDLDALKPIGRLSGPRYARVSDRFELFREESKLDGGPPNYDR